MDHRASRLFLKGNIGAGKVFGGSLDDEDFVAAGTPCAGLGPAGATCSDTFSEQNGGSLRYFTLDLGYTFYDSTKTYGSIKDQVVDPRGIRLGAFVGYNFWNEKVKAFGVRCNAIDIAVSPFACGASPPGTVVVPFSTLAITNDAHWRSWRLGLTGDVMLTKNLKFTGEAAYVPRTNLRNTDNHVLIPAIFHDTGKGQGVQLEGVLSYQLTELFNVGVGARWWHLGKTDGLSDGVQPITYEADRYGVFVQGSFKLN